MAGHGFGSAVAAEESSRRRQEGIEEMEKSRLFCSGYSAPEGNDILEVLVNEEGETKITGGIRQGDNPSFCLIHEERLYSVAELQGKAFICSRAIEGTAAQALPNGCNLEKQEKRIRVPGGELCHLYAGERALFGSSYGTGDFFAVDYDLTEILWHVTPGALDRAKRTAEENSGQNEERQEGPHAHWTTEWEGVLWLADLGCDRIFRYRMENGLPCEELEALVLENGAGPRQVLPIGRKDCVLSVQELDSTLRLWKRQPLKGEGAADAQERMTCVQKVRTTAADGENYPGTICLADESTVLVCNRGANTIAAFGLEEDGLIFAGEWPTGDWPRYIKKIPGTDLIANACNQEGVVVIFAWRDGKLEEKGRIALHGASGMEVQEP